MKRQLTLSPTSKFMEITTIYEEDALSPSSPASTVSTFELPSPPSSPEQLPRFNPIYHFKPIAYPYTSSSLGTKLRGALRQRRRSSFTRLAQRKALHLIFSLLIPLLLILLIQEWKIHSARRTVKDSLPGLFHTRPIDLSVLRDAYEQKRRLDIAVLRSRLQNDKRNVDDFNLDWNSEQEDKLQFEVGDVWPEWWGNVDVVGKTPFDHSPSIVGTRRVLFLTDYTDYLERMNTHTYEIVDAALRHPNVVTDVWGPGWKGYDRSIPLSENIKRRQQRIYQIEKSKLDHQQAMIKRKSGNWFGTRMEENGEEFGEWVQPEWDLDNLNQTTECGPIHFDIVLTISDIYKQSDPHVDALGCGSLLVQQLGDCHSWRCMKEWYPLANNITLSKYAFELPEIFSHDLVKEKFPQWQMGIFGHSPDTANEWDFWPLNWNERKADATMFGFDGSFYPIRTTVTDYTRENDQATIIRHGHPGYTLSIPNSARENPLETYTKSHELYTKHEELREDFARGMRESRICVFDASLERKLIRKYAQALLSGCVIAADLPTEHEEALGQFVIPLKPSWDITRIKQEIGMYLDQPARLHQMALDGFIYARQHLTSTRKVSDIIRMADAHNQGVRGYDMPFSFSLRCRAYWREDSYRPPWCRKEDHYRGLEG